MRYDIGSASNAIYAQISKTLGVIVTTQMNDYKRLFSENQLTVNHFNIELNNPATKEELNELELNLNQTLPSDILEFYKFCNGLETSDMLFRILPIKEIIKYKNELDNGMFHFAEYMIYSDQWLIKLIGLESYEILNNNHESANLKIQTNSIFEFLKIYLESGLFGESENDDFWERLTRNKNNYT